MWVLTMTSSNKNDDFEVVFVVEGQESVLGDVSMEDHIDVDQYLLTMDAERATQIVPLQKIYHRSKMKRAPKAMR